ncbi:hypothetical protein GP486_003148 [Trichoglossum hirsutum]|uniref:BTB domain-containing protein n=1 Tax=Trichoglossum hirsutum TaxID=265104 RepID=A0A9P8LDQ9_9PEZI|nr:hypothetical protein GP486_003148 [Trichoglossum hirsutum]
MTPQPRQHKPQTQPITTTLANILRDYHAGGTVLRELLQNADDAGATRVDFHLHTSPPPSSSSLDSCPLLHPSLLEFQGPALLAYNNHPPFRPEDFESLSHVGDSGKQRDPTKTGKFGLGFNSVYNWTDAPTVLSGESLLLLDPHHGWSAELGAPGGPVYDFVADGESDEMRNQLKPFAEVLTEHDFRRPLDGTMIRLPLRTEKQAQISQICQKSVAAEEIRDVLKTCAGWLGEGYGVFLRGVKEIGLWEGGERIGGCEIVGGEEVERARRAIDAAYSDVFVNESKDEVDIAFEMELKVYLPEDGGQSRKSTWAVQHLMRRDVGEELTEWGREKKLFGWIGIAAPVEGLSLECFTGGLFTVLPLNKPVVDCPVHLHGLFSITSDRANLHSTDDRTDPRPFLWNKMLFDSLFPVAWVKLLSHLCCTRPHRGDLMHFWPRAVPVVDQLGSSLCERVFEHINSEGLELFFTGKGYTSIDKCLFVRVGDVSQELRNALDIVGVPVVYLELWEDWIFAQVLTSSPSRLLTPQSLCDFLRLSDSVDNAGPEARAALLEYILSRMRIDTSGSDFDMLSGIPLFRLESGTYEAVGSDIPRIFVCLDELERNLFRLRPERNLDCSLLSADIITLLERLAQSYDIPISTYSIDDFSEYCLETVFLDVSEDQDIVQCSPDRLEFVDLAWTWIRSRWSRLSLKGLRKLWLMPLQGGCLRKVYPERSAVPTLHSLSGMTGQLLLRLAALSQQSTLPPLLDEEALCVDNLEFLISRDGVNDELLLGSCEELRGLLLWLVAEKETMWSASEQDKKQALAMIAAKFKVEVLSSAADTDATAKALRQLPLFEQAQTVFVADKMQRRQSWIDGVDETRVFIGCTDLPFVPSTDGTAFICTGNEHVKDMFTATGIVQWPSITDLIERYLIPALTDDTCGLLPSAIKVMTAELIFRNYYGLSKEGKASIYKLPIVPVEGNLRPGENLRSDEESRFCSTSELFHPTAREIDGLFFPEELVYPRMSLFDDFGGAMLQCGLRWKLTWPLALERIRVYARAERPLEEVAARVKELFRLKLGRDIKYSSQDLEEVNSLLWIPVRRQDDLSSLVRTSPQYCRSSSDRLIVGRVLPILEYGVHGTWQSILGWYTTFHVDTLVRQLQAGAAEGDLDIVNAVLTYITQRGLQKDSADALRPINCILGSCGTLFPPAKVFVTGAARLSPYLGNIHIGFQKRYRRLLEVLGVSMGPSLQDLLQVQELLVAAENPLSNADVAVAIEVVNLASKFDRAKLAELKVPDQANRLQSIENIAFWDLEFSSTREKAPLVHPNVPVEVVERLSIQPFSEKILMGKMGIHDRDDDGDEFYQHEKTTTRIADTLGRYPISTTFNEYLANAEDSGTATRVDWLLDECLNGSYPTERLLSKDLAAFQGEALFVHNDGVFLDKDFEGLRNVGRGSKREETWTIGQFGRGAQTMYHWTDVPMLVSGKYLLVLDPQQKYLPLNRRYGRRKPGLRVELATIRDICCDQLTPFHGLWGYSQDMDSYEGTIFRFPLRPQGSKTTLTENRVNLGVNAVREHLEKYFQTARLSLVFLQRIKQISFRFRHMKEPHFRVEYTQRFFPLLCTQPYRYIHMSYLYRGDMQRRFEGTDEWWIAKSDIQDVPASLQEWQKNVRRRVKDSKCGIALLCSPPKDAILEPQMFSSLPLPFASHLPVHINASFILSGDRQSILIGGSSPHEGSAWNRWLLREPIPRLYVDFLNQIVRRFGTQAYDYWPTGELSKDGPSDLIRTGFWEEVARSSNRLYPKAAPMTLPCIPGTDGQVGEQRDTPEPPVHFELKEAVFDFISADSSYVLQDVFRGWFPGLVRVPGDQLPIDFGRLGSAKTELTPSMIRRKLLDGGAYNELQNYADGNSGVLDDLLQIILPKKDAEASEVAELNNCPILPLQDGSLGILRYLKSSQSPQVYFCVTAEERKIFGFASNIFVRGEIIENSLSERSFQSGGVGREFIPWVFNSSMFNVRELTVQDLGQLLQQRAASEWESTPALESWLEAFWFYFRIRMPIDKLGGTRKDITAHCGIENFPVFQAMKGGQTVHISPASFETLPAVVEPPPRFEGLLELCLRFPDLYIVNRRMTPFSLEEDEPETEFFVRFLNAIADIASAKKTSWETIVSSAIDDSSRKILLGLTLRALSDPKFDSTFGLVLRGIMGSLPIWPTTPGNYVTAYNSLAMKDDRLVVPWLKERHRFIDNAFFQEHSGQLKKLGVTPRKVTSMFRDYILTSIPVRLQPEQHGAYLSLIQAMAAFYDQEKKFSHLRLGEFSTQDENKLFGRERVTRYLTWKLAADRDGVMHQASALYDHDDRVYTAAYGSQPDKFLLTTVKSYRDFWVAMGLISGFNISGSEYLNCLLSLERRIGELDPPNTRPPNLISDIGDVLQGICRVPTCDIPAYARSRITSLLVVPTRADASSEPAFRRPAMQQLSDSKPYMSLSEVIHSDHMRCCWTQVPFPFRHLLWSDLSKFQLIACPPANMVWDHLKALVVISTSLQDNDVKEFLDDLSRTYRYLQDNTFDQVDVSRERLWLNMDIVGSNLPGVQEIRTSWMDASRMVLFCPYDPGEMKYVRSYLMPFEALLKRCGCQPIRNPTWTKSGGKPTSGPTMSEVSRLWKDQRLTDVVFSAEGQNIAAHKLVLAAASKYCEAQFTGPWSNVSTGETPIVIEGMAYSTLHLMITYAYDDALDWDTLGVSNTNTAEIADKLDFLLDLLAGADRWDMSRLHSTVETYILDHARTFVRVDNVTHIQDIAAEVQAKDLASFCAEYRKVNREILAVVEGELELGAEGLDSDESAKNAVCENEQEAEQPQREKGKWWSRSWKGLMSLVTSRSSGAKQAMSEVDS